MTLTRILEWTSVSITRFGVIPGWQMPTKALSCKNEAICEHGPEAPSCPVGQDSIKMDCFKVEKCSMVRRVLVGNH